MFEVYGVLQRTLEVGTDTWTLPLACYIHSLPVNRCRFVRCEGPHAFTNGKKIVYCATVFGRAIVALVRNAANLFVQISAGFPMVDELLFLILDFHEKLAHECYLLRCLMTFYEKSEEQENK